MLKLPCITLLTCTLLCACTSVTAVEPPPDALRPLIESIGQRIDIANEVALSKWYSGKPVQDSNRERQVILGAQALAEEFKLNSGAVGDFISAQMEANKLVQYARIAQWHEQGQAPGTPPSALTSGLRSRLDALQRALIQQYARFSPYRNQPACRSWLQAQIKRQTSDPVIVIALQRATGELCLATPSA